MNQIKVGKFIQERRKALGLTQLQLANQLNITDRAVSKWENGRSLPDAGIMIELCQILGISVNELLSGECLQDEKTYGTAAENNLLSMHKEEKAKNRLLIQLEVVILFLSILSFMVMIETVAFPTIPSFWRIVLIVAACLSLGIGVFYGFKLEFMAGWYVCPHCEETYVPHFGMFCLSPHMGLTRYMKCPKCAKWGWHRKVFTKENE